MRTGKIQYKKEKCNWHCNGKAGNTVPRGKKGINTVMMTGIIQYKKEKCNQHCNLKVGNTVPREKKNKYCNEDEDNAV